MNYHAFILLSVELMRSGQSLTLAIIDGQSTCRDAYGRITRTARMEGRRD